MLGYSKRNYLYHSRLLQDITPTVKVSVYGSDGNSDTYITNKTADITVAVFEKYSEQFIPITDLAEIPAVTDDTTGFVGGDAGNTLYRARRYLKVGGAGKERYRAVILLNPRSFFSNAVSNIQGYTSGSPYTIVNATLNLTRSSGATGTNLQAFLMPLTAVTDASVSWLKPSEGKTASWTLAGGDAEPTVSEIVPNGVWNGSTVSFDITPFLNVWDATGTSQIAVCVKSDEADSTVTEFYSWESESTLIGGAPLQNCKFLSTGSTNTTNTEGIRVLVRSNGSTTIELADERTTAVQQWNSFGAATSTGSTFSFFSPDTEQGVVLGTVLCTLTDRTTTATGSPIVVSGLSLPNGITEYYTTAEFSGTSTIPAGTNILEITSPNAQTKTDVSGLVSDETLLVNYLAGSTASNARSFTVKFTADETLKQNRVRVYLNETAIAENRIGLNTELSKVQNRPILKTDLLLS